MWLPSNKSEEFPQILQPWWLSLKNFQEISRELFPVTDSLNWIGPLDDRFLWDHSFETQFQEILEKFVPTKFLRFSGRMRNS